MTEQYAAGVCSVENNKTYPVAIDCDILQNQFILGSCIVGYVLEAQLIKHWASVCRMCMTEKNCTV